MKTRISYNPFARLDPVRHYNERWHRRQTSRAMAILVGLLALLVFFSKVNGQSTFRSPPFKTGEIASSGGVLRGSASPKGRIVGKVAKAASVKVAVASGEWLLVEVTGKTGWILAASVIRKQPEAAASTKVLKKPENIWKTVAWLDNDDSWQINESRIITRSNVKETWVRTVNESPEAFFKRLDAYIAKPSDGLKEPDPIRMELQRFDCVNRRMGLLNRITYDKAGKVLDDQSFEKDVLMVPVVPETNGESLFDAVCGNGSL